MNVSAPRISVGMPVYNGEPYLEEAIQCVLRQTYEDFALFISDNASRDRTEQICRDYASKDKRVRYTRNTENIGAAKNYNRVFHLASGAPYFRWFNADDVSAPDLHEKCIAVLESRPDVVVAYGQTGIIDREGKLTTRYADNLDLQQDNADERFIQFYKSVGLTNIIYGLMRTSAVAETALMGDGNHPDGDINFMAELTLYGKFVEISDLLFYRRMHPGASTWDRDDDAKSRAFWTGVNRTNFTFPYWKYYLANFRAVRAAPIGRREKLRVQRYILQSMIWLRRQLLTEIWYEFLS